MRSTSPCCVVHVLGLKNSSHVRGHVENESHVDGRRDLAWTYKRGWATLHIANWFMVEHQLSSIPIQSNPFGGWEDSQRHFSLSLATIIRFTSAKNQT
ncbi:hypothetical protein DVH24_033060 [Malus domestica]|uniref:Uncharacterized protein n=1 Tax=Malus domestica TaxID=3750 RepID=A0A498J6S6_MALDO|nr:hypothetical protein DVH24_033060 [Malus domestica]